MPEPAPIFIFGVPRSGTTLLRTLLDSHSAIACGPETPWLGGHQPRSIMELVRFLAEDEHGYCRSFGMDRAVVTAAARRLVSDLLAAYAAARGKRRWAEKTPDNVLYIDFLLELFPEAKVLWLTRNGLDVAVSTSIVAEHRKGISRFLEQHISLGPGTPPLDNTPFNAVLRWRHWNRLVARSLHGRDHLNLTYERLVTEPEATMRQVCEYIGESFEPAMLEYSKARHEYPRWEWGSADVRAQTGITRDRTGRAAHELSAAQISLLRPLVNPSTAPDAEDLSAAAAEELAQSLSRLAVDLKLPPIDSVPADVLAWIWRQGLMPLKLEATRVYDLAGVPALPWVLSLLGARVTIVTADPKPRPALTTLAARARLGVDIAVLQEERIPAPDAKADLITALWPHAWRNSQRLLDQAARVVKPGGILLIAGEMAATLPDSKAFDRRVMSGGRAAILTRH